MKGSVVLGGWLQARLYPLLSRDRNAEWFERS